MKNLSKSVIVLICLVLILQFANADDAVTTAAPADGPTAGAETTKKAAAGQPLFALENFLIILLPTWLLNMLLNKY